MGSRDYKFLIPDFGIENSILGLQSLVIMQSMLESFGVLYKVTEQK